MASAGAAWTSKRSPQKHPEKIFRAPFDPSAGLQPYQAPQTRLRARAQGEQRRARLEKPADGLKAVLRDGRQPRRDQPARRHQGGRLVALDAEDRTSTTTPVPPQGHRGAARPRTRRTPPRSGRQGAHLNYIAARRQHRLPGERRRPGDGHDGHHQAPRRRARPTSSTSAAARPRSRSPRPSDHPCRPEREGGARQHLRRDHEVRRHRRRASSPREAVGFKVPLVVRLEGTNVELGKELLAPGALSHRPRGRPRRRRNQAGRRRRVGQRGVAHASNVSPTDSSGAVSILVDGTRRSGPGDHRLGRRLSHRSLLAYGSRSWPG